MEGSGEDQMTFGNEELQGTQEGVQEDLVQGPQDQVDPERPREPEDGGSRAKDSSLLNYWLATGSR